MTRDFRDLALEQLADDERLLREQLAHVDSERDAYRALALEALLALSTLTTQLDRIREQHWRLRDEYATLRRQLLEDVAA